ncbi:MAG: TRAP transporter large permease subunit, partial [Alphaproteobacteria bacterium]
MEKEVIGLIGLGVLFALILIRVPVGLAMTGVGIGGTFFLTEAVSYYRWTPYLKQFKTLLWSTVGSYELSVIPLFIFMGFVAAHAGL